MPIQQSLSSLLANRIPLSLKRTGHGVRVRVGSSIRAAQLLWLRRRAHRQGKKVIGISLIEHFGDIVAAEPISRLLRRTYPDDMLVWCLQPSYRELLACNPHIDRVLEVGCLTEWIRLSDWNLFDGVVDLHFPLRVCSICQIGIRKRRGDLTVDMKTYLNFGSLLKAYCLGAGLPVLDEQPRVYIPPAVAARIDSLGLPPRYLVIHCQSNDSSKDWPAAKWHRLVEVLVRDHGQNIVEVGLRRYVPDIESPGYYDLCGRLSILETAELISRAAMFIGVDSGPAHLANAAGIPGVVLLGEFLFFKRYLPYSGPYANGKTAELVYAEGPAAGIEFERVLEAVTRQLARHAL